MGNDVGKPKTNRELLLLVADRVKGMRLRIISLEAFVYGGVLTLLIALIMFLIER